MTVFASGAGINVDFSEIAKFNRYYQFESLNLTAVASQAVTAVNDALTDGRLEKALALLARSSPKISAREAATVLFAKVEDSLTSFAASTDRSFVSNENWARLVTKHEKPWSLVRNRALRESARVVYPFVAPVVRAVRRSLDFRMSDKG
jgi:hypothetical protein